MDNDRQKMRFDVFLGATILHSILSSCNRLHTACAIIKNKRLQGVGYNGSVNGEPHCDDVGHLMVEGHCVRTRHGEKNAISNTDRCHIRDGEAIVIATPCIECAKDLIHEGVKAIHYVGSYANAKGNEEVAEIAQRQHVVMRQFDLDFAELFQRLFDLMARPGGVLNRAGYRLKISKEPLE